MLGLGGAVKIAGAEPLCRPPGGQDEDHFIGTCLRCEKCREVCPNGVIRPAHLEDGLINMRTPTLNFKLGICDYCQESFDGVPQCVRVCPTEALRLPADATPESVIIGKAIIKEEWCLGWQLKGCRKCYDACPYEAIELDENARPLVILDNCNGCGICENVCVSMKNAALVTGATDRAILVKPAEIVDRLLAEKAEGGLS